MQVGAAEAAFLVVGVKGPGAVLVFEPAAWREVVVDLADYDAVVVEAGEHEAHVHVVEGLVPDPVVFYVFPDEFEIRVSRGCFRLD